MLYCNHLYMLEQSFRFKSYQKLKHVLAITICSSIVSSKTFRIHKMIFNKKEISESELKVEYELGSTI